MTIHDLLEYGENVLRNDREYWEEMDRIKSEMDKLVYRQNKIMAAAIIRLAVAMVTEKSNSRCADCTGGYCEEECMEVNNGDEK